MIDISYAMALLRTWHKFVTLSLNINSIIMESSEKNKKNKKNKWMSDPRASEFSV